MRNSTVARLAAVTVAAFFTVSGQAQAAGPTAAPAPQPPSPAAAAIAAAVADPSRIAEARVRDPFRKPAEILAFGGVHAGETILEIAPGGGYDTALLSRVVGPAGKVYSVDSDRLFEFRPSMRASFTKFAAQDPRSNVEYSVQRLDALKLPGQVDCVWVDMFYHDTVWLGVDRAAMNKAFFDYLKPGGSYVVVDHKALPGSGEAITGELHRIDPAIVRREIEAAGFKLVAESDALANPQDPHTATVFDPAIRGRTDRFVWKFVKPK